MKLFRVLSLLLALLLTAAALAVTTGEVPPALELTGKKGGRVDGTPWSSTEIKGKVFTLMYVDPDDKELNVHVEQALKAKDYPKDRYGSIAVINMEATWKPNAIINSILKKKQKEFPDTIYVRDMDFYLATAWGLKKKSSYAVLTFDAEGKLLFMKDGKLTDAELEKLIQVIDQALAQAETEIVEDE